MNLQDYILGIQLHLIKTHQKVLEMFDINSDVRNYRPKDQGWTISEILEHIALTSHFLLILIEKGTDKALKNVQNLSLTEEMEKEKFDLRKIDNIGIHKSFDWIRPEHMEPDGQKTDYEIKTELINQLHICLNQLQKLKGGEGLLYKTTMTVNGLGKLNVYEYILFLSKHAERHLFQIEENIKEYSEKNNL